MKLKSLYTQVSDRCGRHPHTMHRLYFGRIGKYLATCTPEDIKWYNDWTRGQQHSGYPGVILMTAEEKRRKKALKALESRKLIKTKKKGPGRRRPKKT